MKSRLCLELLLTALSCKLCIKETVTYLPVLRRSTFFSKNMASDKQLEIITRNYNFRIFESKWSKNKISKRKRFCSRLF